MSRELLILRHGKSDWDAGFDDLRRPLKKRGKYGAKLVGRWLAEHELIPEVILTSPATRALTTAQKCAKNMENSQTIIIQNENIYLAELEQLLGALATTPADTKRVMLVGHNPGLEELVKFLAEETIKTPTDGKLLPTATLAQLQTNQPWDALSQGCAHLMRIVRPSDIEKPNT